MPNEGSFYLYDIVFSGYFPELCCYGSRVFFLWLRLPSAKSKHCAARAAYVQSGRIKLGGVVKLKGVMVATNEGTLAQSPFFQTDEIELKFSPWRLLRGQFRIHSVALKGMFIGAQYYVPDDEWNIPGFNFGSSSSSQGLIPFVTVHDGTVQISRVESGTEPVTVTVGLNGQIAADTQTGQYSFKLEADDRFGFDGSSLEGVLKVPGSAGLGHLSMRGKLLMHDKPVFANAWNVNDFIFECEFDRQQVMLKRCNLSTDCVQADIHGRLQKDADEQNWFDLDINLTDFRLSDSYQPDTFVYGQLVESEIDSPLIRFLQQYRPCGSGGCRVVAARALK